MKKEQILFLTKTLFGKTYFERFVLGGKKFQENQHTNFFFDFIYFPLRICALKNFELIDLIVFFHLVVEYSEYFEKLNVYILDFFNLNFHQ